VRILVSRTPLTGVTPDRGGRHELEELDAVEAAMLTAVAVVTVLLIPMLALFGALRFVEARQRARARVIAQQVRLTDAIHAELGAVVAPIVDKHAFRPWRVTFPLAQGHAREVGRLIAITDRVLEHERVSPDDVQIVFTRPAEPPRAHAA
jgi:hypothetical protein